jgi:hypothetical protein
MHRLKRFHAAEIVPCRRDVLRRMEMPADAAISPELETILAGALARFLEIADPVGLVDSISCEEFSEIYRGEGRNAPATPLQTIAVRAERLSLFVATVGQPLSDEIGEAFVSGDPAFGLVLDALATEGVNRLAYRLGADALECERNARRVSREAVVLPYSPGSCGWHMSGQRALFGAIKSGTIGVSLGRSCLMSPIKSVSGVFVAGPPHVHRVRPRYAFCDECATRECLSRMASLRKG